MAYLWSWFIEISAGIDGNGTSYPVITWEAIRAWAALTGEQIEPRDARVIIMLGDKRAAIMTEAMNAQIKNAGQR